MSDIRSLFPIHNTKLFNVKIGEIVVVKAPAILKTTLGSCVAVILYDGINKIGSMIHVMFPDSKDKETDTPGKFANLGIPLLVKKTLETGASKKNLEVLIVGGNYLTENDKSTLAFNVGKTNLKAGRLALRKENLVFKEFDIQQNTGTIAIFDVAKGKLKVKYLERFKREDDACFQKTNLISYNDFIDLVKDTILMAFKLINSKYEPAFIGENNNSYDTALSVNIFGSVKGKLILYVNKKFIHSLFSNSKLDENSKSKFDFTKVLNKGADIFLNPLIKKLSHLFTEKSVRVKFTSPLIFKMTKYVNLESNYPELLSANFDVNSDNIKISLALGEMKKKLK